MKRMLVLVLVAGSLAMVAGCGDATTAHTSSTTAATATCQEVQMEGSGPGRALFVPATCTVHAGARINFVNQTPAPVSLYAGTNEVFQANPDGPDALNHSGGVMVYPNDSYGVKFFGGGTFNLTALPAAPSPQMNFTVTVLVP